MPFNNTSSMVMYNMNGGKGFNVLNVFYIGIHIFIHCIVFRGQQMERRFYVHFYALWMKYSEWGALDFRKQIRQVN